MAFGVRARVVRRNRVLVGLDSSGGRGNFWEHVPGPAQCKVHCIGNTESNLPGRRRQHCGLLLSVLQQMSQAKLLQLNGQCSGCKILNKNCEVNRLPRLIQVT